MAQMPKKWRGFWQITFLGSTALSVFCVVAQGAQPLPKVVEFNRDIRPILSDTCFQCHGPDEAQREGDLRFDKKEAAFAKLDDHFAIVPGSLDKSALYRRVTSSDPDERMPPADSGKQLTDRQIALFRLWIEQGAKWQSHWSFLTPTRPELPQVSQQKRIRNGIDSFVLARLEREGLEPSPEAGKERLIRRVTLDLTGLPPTPKEVDDFLKDTKVGAYERVVDRLLGSEHYGERMATEWLDVARYADTSGYQTDGERHMWRWRDWVIDSFNRNQPFDQFTVEQLAGDLLPNPTLDQLIATGFNRNHRSNSEGGIVFEEYLVEYAVDRVETTATVWLGLTMGCARCHDHKFDPFTQKDFYGLFAFFNNIPERGRVIKNGNSAPLIKAPTPAQRNQLDQLDQQLSKATRLMEANGSKLRRSQRVWEADFQAPHRLNGPVPPGQIAYFPLDGNVIDGNVIDGDDGSRHGRFVDGAADYQEGKIGKAARLDGKRFIRSDALPEIDGKKKFSCGAWIHSSGTPEGTILSRLAKNPFPTGFALHASDGHLELKMGPRWLDDGLRLETTSRLAPGRWQHVMMTYDGTEMAAGVRLYIDGQVQPLHVSLDMLTGGFKSKEPLRIGARDREVHFSGAIDEVRWFERQLSPEEVAILATTESIDQILGIPVSKRTRHQDIKLATYYLENHAPKPLRQAYRQLTSLRETRQKFYENIPTTMIMQDSPEARETFILVRGEYDKPGKKVTAATPNNLLSLPEQAARNRLGLARWLVDPAHPLTARVTVNRYWQMYFGNGLVKTSEDFGSQGRWPTHPQLLDWLATEFVRSDWDVKALQKLIVTSNTYRQSSKVTPELLQRDPENQLLARGPRLRLSAEVIRDQALAASGLLVDRIGGPSVKPYQPKGLWSELTSLTYKPDEGEGLYRRSMYTFWKRTIPPPTMTTFDATSRETCTVFRSRTNTPLQALALMNDVTYVESARALAERMISEADESAEYRVTHGFRLVLGRRPVARELQVLQAGLKRFLRVYKQNPEAAQKLITQGHSQPKDKIDAAELAAYTAIASLILNLDETVTKE